MAATLTDCTLILRKIKDTGNELNTGTYGAYVGDSMPTPAFEAKDAEVNDWLDEHGEDVYDADNVYMKAADISIPMVMVGTKPTEVLSNYNEILTWLTTGGTQMYVEQAWTQQKWPLTRWLGMSDNSLQVLEGQTILTFNMKIRIQP